MRITVIGAGNMGGALVRGWMKKNVGEITATARSEKKLSALASEYSDLVVTTDNRAAVKDADVVVIAVKPWVVDELIESIADLLKGKTVISVAAKAKNPAINVYAMPNIAAEFGECMTFLLNEGKAEDVALAEELFAKVGSVLVVDEKGFNAGNMLAGCGIAYVMRFIRAMMAGGVELGLYPDTAKAIAMQTMKGAVAVLEETGLHPEAAIDKVTTPGGMTIKGLNELDASGFNAAVVRCLKAGLK